MKCWIELKRAMVKIWWNCLSWTGHELIDFQTWGFLKMWHIRVVRNAAYDKVIIFLIHGSFGHYLNRRKFRSQTSDNMDRWKAEMERVREKRKIRREKSRRERVRRKKMQMRKKVGKSRNTVFFQWFGAPEGRKVGSLKRRVRSQLARWEMKNCTPLWREAHFEVKMYKKHQLRTILLVEMSKKCTPLWREAHFQVKMHKTHQLRTTFGSWDVEKCTPLWREAHFEVKMYKAHHCRTTFGSWDVEKVHAVVARSTFRSQNVQNTPWSEHFWKLRCRKSAHRCGAKHIWKSKC